MVTWEETDFSLNYSIERERGREEEKLVLEGSEDICNKGIYFYSVIKLFSVKVKDFVKFHISAYDYW